MTEDSRQTTLNAPTGDISSLEDIDWTFERANTQEHTHGLHSYPARMIPQIPETLLSYYKQQGTIDYGDRVYDPFSGSGTTAVEARLAGLHCEANDINPLACLLTLAKSRPLDIDLLDIARHSLTDGLQQELNEVRDDYVSDELEIDRPEVRDGWFPEPQLYELVAIRDRISSIETTLHDDTEAETEQVKDVVRFLRVSLSSTARQVSYQRNGEYKRYRIPEEDRVDHDPDVYAWFTTELDDDIERARAYSRTVDHSLRTEIHYADSRTATDNGEESVDENSADIVITSPPYGDHQTTVAYGQFSQDPAIVAGQYGYDEMKDVDKTGLGGSYSLEPLEELEQWSKSLAATMDALRESDGRAKDAIEFFTDYYAVMEQISKILKPGQPVAWVVANRTMSRVNIPTHLITKELCEHLGFQHEHMLPREIPTKTLPWENAPENTPGVKGKLMSKENIVVMTSPDE